MITAVHAMLYSRDAQAARVFFRDTLKLESVDAGDGWLIFALPPSEMAVHPTHADHGPELYFMCDDVERTVAELEPAGVKMTRPLRDQGWGLVTSIRIPGNIEVGLYEPRHPTAVSISKPEARRPRASRRPARKAAKKRR